MDFSPFFADALNRGPLLQVNPIGASASLDLRPEYRGADKRTINRAGLQAILEKLTKEFPGTS
jgi:hypothetical protein